LRRNSPGSSTCSSTSPHDDAGKRVAFGGELQEIGFADVDLGRGLKRIVAHDVLAEFDARRADIDADHTIEPAQGRRAAEVVAVAGADLQIGAARAFRERRLEKLLHGNVVRPQEIGER
jgi:hypothetical protein